MCLVVSAFAVSEAALCADKENIVVAYGASIAHVGRVASAQYQTAGNGMASPLREGGLSADSIVLAVDTGKAALGLSGNSWDNIVKLLKEKRIDLKNFVRLQHEEIGKDQVALVTYKGGPKELSKEQIKKIFTGAVQNWKDVGGEDLPIQLVYPVNTPATQKSISEDVMDNEPLTQRGVKAIEGLSETAQYVAETKGAIGFSSPLVDLHGANRPKHPMIVKEITAIYLGKPTVGVEGYIHLARKILSEK